MFVNNPNRTTVGHALSNKLSCEFQDADQWHSTDNTKKMSEGVPLTDEDRFPWLQALHQLLNQWASEGRSGILACSALRRCYRDVLVGRGGTDDLSAECLFVLLQGEKQLIAQRLAGRKGHYMPKSLLQSQLEILEEPAKDERHFVCSVDEELDSIVTTILKQLS